VGERKLASVLVVDDDPVARRSAKSVLGATWIVHTADSIAAAQASLSASLPKIVVCDLRLGTESGLSFLRDVRERSPEIPTALVSGVLVNEVSIEACEIGVTFIAEKPFSLRTLVERMGALVPGDLTKPTQYVRQPHPAGATIRDERHSYAEAMSDFERSVLAQALERNNGNVSATARDLGMHRSVLKDRIVAYWQTDYPSVTTSKRYVVTDETDRPIQMWTWPASGDSTLAWSINPSAWGFDLVSFGLFLYQPILFAGQYQDRDTTAYLDDGFSVHRPGFAWNRVRSYDPLTGSCLQLGTNSENAYIYAASNPVRGNRSLEHLPDSSSLVPTPDDPEYNTRGTYFVHFFFTAPSTCSDANVSDLEGLGAVVEKAPADDRRPTSFATLLTLYEAQANSSTMPVGKRSHCTESTYFRALVVKCNKGCGAFEPSCQVDDPTLQPGGLYYGYVLGLGDIYTGKPGVHLAANLSISSNVCSCPCSISLGTPTACCGLSPDPMDMIPQ